MPKFNFGDQVIGTRYFFVGEVRGWFRKRHDTMVYYNIETWSGGMFIAGEDQLRFARPPENLVAGLFTGKTKI